MTAVSSPSPPDDPSSTPCSTETRSLPPEPVARPPHPTELAIDMNSQPSSPLRAYPEPAAGGTQIPGAAAYFTNDRTEQPALSQEEQNLANSLSHDMNGHIGGLSPQIGNEPAQGFGIGAQSHLSRITQPALDAAAPGQHSGADPNKNLSYGLDQERRKRSKVSRACDECRRKKVRSEHLSYLLLVDVWSQVRCDSTSSDSNTIETCSNCQRQKLTCQFERAPMKRGPSKG